MKGKCEAFNRGHCLGCNGFEEDVNKVKYKCEIYKKEIKKEKINYGNKRI